MFFVIWKELNVFINFGLARRIERGYGVAQLVEARRYKPEGRRFDFRWGHWDFSLTSSFHLHYDTGLDSAPNRNEYQGSSPRFSAAGAYG